MSSSSTLDHDTNSSSTYPDDQTITKRLITTHPQYISPPFSKSSLASNPIDQFSTWFTEISSPSFNPIVISPETVCLSTFNFDTFEISSRFVLMKQIDSRGLVFFTNYNSRKSKDIQSTLTKMNNSHHHHDDDDDEEQDNNNNKLEKEEDRTQRVGGAMAFYWQPIHRQIRFTGIFERLSHQENNTYFQSRPLDSKIGAWASPQSQPLSSRQELDSLVEQVQQRFSSLKTLQKQQDEIFKDDQISKNHPEEKDNDISIPLPPHWGGYRLVPLEAEFWVGRENRLHDRFVYRRPNIHTQDWTLERLAP